MIKFLPKGDYYLSLLRVAHCFLCVEITCRDGFSVVQVICRNHPNFFPNLICQIFVAVHEMNYPSCFIAYYEIKKGETIPSITQQTKPLRSELDESPFARLRPLLMLPRTTRKKFEGPTGPSFYLEGGGGCTWSFSQITQNSLQLVRITSIVLGTTQTRL